jgi:protein phosphatase 1L
VRVRPRNHFHFEKQLIEDRQVTGRSTAAALRAVAAMLSAPVALCTARAAKAWCISTIQGRRAEQEDRFAVLPRIGATCGFYAVFDGHGGNDCSRYAAATMHEHLLASAAFRTGDMRTALKDAIAATEAGFLRIAHARKLQAGSTALAAIVCAPEGDGWGELTVAHLGDSRAVLCRAGKAVALTVDHKPDDASERARIEAQGGFVTERGYCMRVQGVLAMSRALGNRLLKPYVSDEPTVSSFPLAQHDSFFVLASDGLYDVFDDSEVVKLVRSTKSPEGARAPRGREASEGEGASACARGGADAGPCAGVHRQLVIWRSHACMRVRACVRTAPLPPSLSLSNPSLPSRRCVQAPRGQSLRGRLVRQYHRHRRRAQRCVTLCRDRHRSAPPGPPSRPLPNPRVATHIARRRRQPVTLQGIFRCAYHAASLATQMHTAEPRRLTRARPPSVRRP